MEPVLRTAGSFVALLLFPLLLVAMHKPRTTAAARLAASYREPYTVLEVAKKLRVDPRLVYREIEAGRLEAVRIGRLFRITDEQLDSYLGRKTK